MYIFAVGVAQSNSEEKLIMFINQVHQVSTFLSRKKIVVLSSEQRAKSE